MALPNWDELWNLYPEPPNEILPGMFEITLGTRDLKEIMEWIQLSFCGDDDFVVNLRWGDPWCFAALWKIKYPHWNVKLDDDGSAALWHDQDSLVVRRKDHNNDLEISI